MNPKCPVCSNELLLSADTDGIARPARTKFYCRPCKTYHDKDLNVVEVDKCPHCGKPGYRGFFFSSCVDPECKGYDSFAMSRCGICGSIRKFCAC